MRAAGIPDDADLILVTHGHFDHSGSAPDLAKTSKKPNVKVVSNYEIGTFFKQFHGIGDDKFVGLNKGGQVDFGFVNVQMVSADHSSGCLHDGNMHVGGEPAGFVISAHNFSIYHGGDTNVFGDMEIVDYLYKPTHALIPIGGHFTMGPREAAFAIAKLLRNVKVVIPMHFGTFPLLKGNIPDFEKHLQTFTAEFKREAVKVVDPHTIHSQNFDLPW